MRITLVLGLVFGMVFFWVGPAAAGGGSPGEVVLVGMLTEQAVRQCQGISKEPKWVHPHLEIGFVWAYPHKGFKFHKTRLVIARGHKRPRPPLRVKQLGPCPDMQMRSDWVVGKSGTRLRRDGSPPFNDAFSTTQVADFAGLTFKDKGESMLVSFENTTGYPLEDFKMIVHYEGCYGKPGSVRRESGVKRLEPGKRVEKLFAKVVEGNATAKWRRVHLASAVQISAQPHPVYFDLDWPLWRVKALKLECPNKRSKHALP